MKLVTVLCLTAIGVGVNVVVLMCQNARELPTLRRRDEQKIAALRRALNDCRGGKTREVSAPDRPHLFMLLADDVGWHSVGWRNHEVLTPNLDRLATREGVILDRHYVYRACSPSRSSLLTGRLAFHVNQANPSNRLPGGGAAANFTLLPEVLGRAGYACHMLGKWHLGLGGVESLPTRRGFDSWLGFFAGSQDHWSHVRSEGRAGARMDLWRDDAPARAEAGSAYSDELYTLGLLDIVDRRPDDKPLFVYLAYHCAHEPLQAPKDQTDKYPLPPEASRADHRRAIFQGMVSFIDDSVGRVEAKLKASGLWTHALVVFSTDNGAPCGTDADSGNNYPLRGGKYSDFEGGVRGTAFVTGGALPVRRWGVRLAGLNHKISIADWFATFADVAGVQDINDDRARDASLPAVDAISAWPLISGASNDSARDEIVLTVSGLQDVMPGSAGGFIAGRYKILFGNQRPAVYPGRRYPNGTRPEPLVVHCGDAVRNRPCGCVFDLDDDPTERRDLALERPDLRAWLTQRFLHYAETAYQTQRFAVVDNATRLTELYAVMEANYNGFWGPYLNLTIADRRPRPFNQPYAASRRATSRLGSSASLRNFTTILE